MVNKYLKYLIVGGFVALLMWVGQYRFCEVGNCGIGNVVIIGIGILIIFGLWDIILSRLTSRNTKRAQRAVNIAKYMIFPGVWAWMVSFPMQGLPLQSPDPAINFWVALPAAIFVLMFFSLWGYYVGYTGEKPKSIKYRIMLGLVAFLIWYSLQFMYCEDGGCAFAAFFFFIIGVGIFIVFGLWDFILPRLNARNRMMVMRE